jgi:hypothetical protein
MFPRASQVQASSISRTIPICTAVARTEARGYCDLLPSSITRRLPNSGTMTAPLTARRSVLRAPPPLLTAVLLSDAGFYSMVLSWSGPPERRITVRLQAPAANLREAQAEAADQLLSFADSTLAWLHENAQPIATHMPEPATVAKRPIERESPPPSSNPERAADSPQSRRPAARAVASPRASDRRQTHRLENGEARNT